MLKLSINIILKLIDEGYRSPNDEIAVALRAAIRFANKIIKELKLQIVLDEIRKLVIKSNNREIDINEKITYIKHQATSLESIPSIVSYASVLSRSSTIFSIIEKASLPILSPAIFK